MLKQPVYLVMPPKGLSPLLVTWVAQGYLRLPKGPYNCLDRRMDVVGELSLIKEGAM